MINDYLGPDFTPLKVRRGGIDDLDPVMLVMQDAFEAGFGERWTRSQCAGILPMHGVRMSVADEAGAVVGFSLMRAVLDESELLLIAVSPDHQGRGIGRLLLDDFLMQASSAGARHLHLEVRDGNPAVSLYLRAGFRIVGRRKSYYRAVDGDSYDALTMLLDH
nr:ribosomal protein S18-alanine N-acetyltransferase [uncultured Sphingomonas sp.]